MDGTTLLQRLSSRTPEPSEAAMTAARAQLTARMDAAPGPEVAPRRPQRTRTVRRGAFLGIGVAAAACSAVLVFTAGPTPTASAEATRTLQAAATAVRSGGAVSAVTRTHQLQLVTSSSGREKDPDGGLLLDSGMLVGYTTTLQRSADGNGWVRSFSATEPLKGWGPLKAKMIKDTLDDPASGPSVDRSNGNPAFWTGVTSLSPAQVRAMPRDPDRLLRKLGGVTDPDSALEPNANRVIDAASALLGSGLADAELQAATYRALERLPDLTVDEHGADIDGRRGVAIGALVSNGLQRIDLIIDPATGRFLGRSEINLTASDGAPAGTLEEGSAVYAD